MFCFFFILCFFFFFLFPLKGLPWLFIHASVLITPPAPLAFLFFPIMHLGCSLWNWPCLPPGAAEALASQTFLDQEEPTFPLLSLSLSLSLPRSLNLALVWLQPGVPGSRHLKEPESLSAIVRKRTRSRESWMISSPPVIPSISLSFLPLSV